MSRSTSVRRFLGVAVVGGGLACFATGACVVSPPPDSTTTTTDSTTTTGPPPTLPRPDHVVVVVEENRSEASIVGNASAPYINSLAASGALFTRSYATDHPSQPNYLALFSGSNQGVTDDSCPPPGSPYSADNLGAQLIAAGRSFTGYAEDLPAIGSTVCTYGENDEYQRHHNPWVDFSNVPSSSNVPFSAFPTDFTTLPTVSFVVPNQQHNMHNGTVAQADTWLRTNLDAYARWSEEHNSLLIVTWDEDDYSSSNNIPTIFFGQPVEPGTYGETINHDNVLRTLEDMYGLPSVANSTTATPILDCWNL